MSRRGPRRVGPTGVLVTSAAPHTPEWHAARAVGIGSSEIAAVLGISPYSSPFDLYWRKLAREHGEPTARMGWGTRLEPVVADYLADDHPEFQLRPTGVIMHADRAWQRAAPDRLVLEAATSARVWHLDPVAVLECKSDGNRDAWGDPGTDQVPPHYLAQTRWQMDTLGVPVAFVSVSFGGPPVEYVVEHHEPDAVLMQAAAVEFLDRLARQDPPPIDAHHATRSRLRRLHPQLDDVEVEVDDDTADEFLAALEQKRAALDAYDLAENRLRAALGDGRWAVRDGRKVATRSVYDVAERDQHVAAHTVNKIIPPRKKAAAA